MNKPIFDINTLGMKVFIEIEGREPILESTVGAMAFDIRDIMDWDCPTLGDIMERQTVEPAPRARYWKKMPTAEERASGEWHNDSRAWYMFIPDWSVGMDTINKRHMEWVATGRVNFEDD